MNYFGHGDFITHCLFITILVIHRVPPCSSLIHSCLKCVHLCTFSFLKQRNDHYRQQNYVSIKLFNNFIVLFIFCNHNYYLYYKYAVPENKFVKVLNFMTDLKCHKSNYLNSNYYYIKIYIIYYIIYKYYNFLRLVILGVIHTYLGIFYMVIINIFKCINLFHRHQNSECWLVLKILVIAQGV